MCVKGSEPNGLVFSLRNAAGNGELVLVRHIGLGFLTTTAFTTPLVITNLTAMGAAGVVRLYVNVEFSIATAF